LKKFRLKDIIYNVLIEKPKSTKVIQNAIPNASPRVLAATISNNPKLFLRLEKGLVGLRNRDEHLITGRPIKNTAFTLPKKIYNTLLYESLKLNDIYLLLPEEKKTSIRATITLFPNLFIRLKRGYIGRKDRDDYLVEKKIVKKTRLIKPTLANKIESILSEGDKDLKTIFRRLQHYPKKSITSQLSKKKIFKKIKPHVWGIKEEKI
jgi:hypothetical protein